MKYKVFASKKSSVEEIEKLRFKNRFWAEKDYTEFREIEAKTKEQAAEIFSDKHQELIDTIGYPVSFYFVDDNGKIFY